MAERMPEAWGDALPRGSAAVVFHPDGGMECALPKMDAEAEIGQDDPTWLVTLVAMLLSEQNLDLRKRLEKRMIKIADGNKAKRRTSPKAMVKKLLEETKQ